MAKEILEKIVQAEKEAEAIVDEANKSHTEIINKAKIKAEEKITSAKNEAESVIEYDLKKAVEDVKNDIYLIEKEADERAIQIRQAAISNREETIEAIMRKVVGE